MAEELFQVQLAKPEREFIKVYKDFFRCSLLNPKEKLVYIGLKDFLNYVSSSGEVFPSIETLSKNCGMDRKTVIKVIKSLESKGIIKKERRGLTKTNLYTIYDNPNMWKADSLEQLQEITESKIELSTEEMLEELKRRGVIEIIDRKKELNSQADQSNELSPKQNSNIKFISNDNTDNTESQVSIEDVKKQIEYDFLLKEVNQTDLDAVVTILYEAYITKKETIKVSGEDKPRAVVQSVLSKLNCYDIQDVLKAYEEEQHNGTIIKNHEAYLLTMLYKAKLQNGQRLNNLGRNNHDW